ncbi:hypothetical protein SUGI_0762840 [Cryptomeria japonica]|nr:hypothetical protein SUGI_0762840 [Cryptomeria japonica]
MNPENEMREMSPENRQLPDSPKEFGHENKLQDAEKGMMESVGDILSSSGVTVKEAVLSKVSVVAIQGGEEILSVDRNFPAAEEVEELNREEGKEKVASEVTLDHVTETDEAFILINSIVRD